MEAAQQQQQQHFAFMLQHQQQQLLMQRYGMAAAAQHVAAGGAWPMSNQSRGAPSGGSNPYGTFPFGNPQHTRAARSVQSFPNPLAQHFSQVLSSIQWQHCCLTLLQSSASPGICG